MILLSKIYHQRIDGWWVKQQPQQDYQSAGPPPQAANSTGSLTASSSTTTIPQMFGNTAQLIFPIAEFHIFPANGVVPWKVTEHRELTATKIKTKTETEKHQSKK